MESALSFQLFHSHANKTHFLKVKDFGTLEQPLEWSIFVQKGCVWPGRYFSWTNHKSYKANKWYIILLATNFFYFWTMYFFSFKMIVFSIWFEFLVIMFNQMENLIPKWTHFSWTFQLMAVYDLQLCTNSHKYALEILPGIDQERPVVI